MSAGHNDFTLFRNQEEESYKREFNELQYAINLLWFNRYDSDYANDQYLYHNRDDIEYPFNQLKKLVAAHPNAQIFIWYDSNTCTEFSISETEKRVKEISDKIILRNRNDIPLINKNHDIFDIFPHFYCIDLAKLIIAAYLLETEKFASVIVNDWSIGDKVERMADKAQLYSKESIRLLKEHGMMLGHDGVKPENQFIQLWNSPATIKALQHTINGILAMSLHHVNVTYLQFKERAAIQNLGAIPFIATMANFHLYFTCLKNPNPILIRADIVNEGTQTEWVTYEPEKHHYLMFGNFLKESTYRFDDASGCFYENAETGIRIAMSEIFKFPTGLNLRHQSGGTNETFYEQTVGTSKVIRKDIHPGHEGRAHLEATKINQPIQVTFSPMSSGLVMEKQSKRSMNNE